MPISSHLCSQCGRVIESVRHPVEPGATLFCPACAKARGEGPAVPACGMECATGGTCGSAVPGFA